jgi:hypothetical protein
MGRAERRAQQRVNAGKRIGGGFTGVVVLKPESSPGVAGPAPQGAEPPEAVVSDSGWRPDPVRVALGNLRGSVARRREAESSVRANVGRARAARATWREIAAVLGVTPEGARKRYR